MHALKKIGYYTERHLASGLLFLGFIGHLFLNIMHAMVGKVKIPWINTLDTLFSSGARLVIPLTFISAVATMSITLNIYYLLSPFGLQNKVEFIAVNIISHDLVPLIIGLVLCIQSSLNLINIQAQKLHHVPHTIILEYIFPILIGINITALLLYTYLFAACLLSMYLTFHYVVHYDIYQFFWRLSNFIRPLDIMCSIFKTLVYATIVSLTVGYYYYEVAIRDILVRRAVSRIITRGLVWIVMASAYLKLFNI